MSKLIRQFSKIWDQYRPFIEAIVELFHPFVEVAVHNLETGKVAAIYHNLSRRKVGEKSPLHELKVNVDDFPSYFSPYYKQNWDGRPLKCTSITLRGLSGKPVGLICVNVDVNFFQEGYELLTAFLKTKEGADNPIEIFGTPIENQLNAILKEKKLSLNHLNREQKKELVQHLYQKGLFNFKNAIPFIAKKLKSSRATIYNYIKDA